MQEQILQFFQNTATPALDILAEGITMLGEQYLFILVITFVYWNLSKKEGFKLASVFAFSSILNNLIKIMVHAPRPFEKLDFIQGKRIETATGYSFPSGHTQGAATFFTSSALILRKGWITVIAVILSAAVGLSRLYLGVHWPVDVLGGLILGILLALLLCALVDRLYDSVKLFRIVFLSLTGTILGVTVFLYLLDLFYLKGSMKIDDFFKISGITNGLVGGFFLEKAKLDFTPSRGSAFKKGIRYVLGLTGTIILLTGLKKILPDAPAFSFLRYALPGFWVSFVWPWLGFKLKLFNNHS